MLKDITIGQHYPSNSVIHKLDARVKLIATLIFMVSLFIIDKFWPYAIVLIALMATIKLSTIPFRYIMNGIKPLKWIIIFTFIINILGTSMLTLTTSPMDLTDGIERLLNPFNKIGLPVHELAMMMTIALRFIPTLLDETDKIMKAQMSRGADFESKNLISRAKNLVPLLVPLFVSAFRRAEELSMAMEARCYRGGYNRTKMRQSIITKKDYIAVCILVVYLVIIIVTRFI